MSTLVQITGLCKSYGPRVILDEANVTIAEKQKIAVIGRNGAGKSTLLKIIVGDEEYNRGSVAIHERTHLGYLAQHDEWRPQETVMEFLQRHSGKETWACAKIASQFQLDKNILATTITSLAGGFQMRVKLSAMLLTEPNLLLLDEPTNYLDLSTLLLLEHFLRSYRGAFLVVSHDREFLKNTCTETLEIDQGKTTLFPGPLEEYLAFKKDQIEMAERYNKKITREKKHLQTFVDRFRYKASKAVQAQSKLKQIDRLKTIEIINPLRATHITIPLVDERKGVALHTHELSIGYPGNIIAKNITIDINRGERVAIVGDNGQGKTTLLKTVAGVLDALAGTFRWGPHISVGYYAQHVPTMLEPHEQVQTYLTRKAPHTKTEDMLAMAGNFLFSGDDIKKPISILSGGEKARLCLAGLLLGRHEVILLDEPTNHLDFETVEALAAALAACNSTILFVSHNRTFVNIVATSIIEVGGGHVKRYHHNYEEYVYHLEKTMEIAPPVPIRKIPTIVPVPENERKQTRLKIKELKKSTHEVELELAELEKEKQKLHSWFAHHAAEYSRAKTDHLKAVQEDIEAKEKMWLELSEKIAQWEAKL